MQGETVYANQFYVVRNPTVATKHIFAGATRVASKVVKSSGAGVPVEQFLYFYHPDHLSSSGYVTDDKAQIFQHEEYFPSGEVWVEEDSNKERTPYLFNSKELDETGLYYFEARYYDPRAGVWESPDPMLDRYMHGQPSFGVYEPRNLGLYTYAWNNPVALRDPTGQCAEDACVIEGAAVGIAFLFLATSIYLSLPATQRSFRESSTRAWNRIAEKIHDIRQPAPVPISPPTTAPPTTVQPKTEEDTKTKIEPKVVPRVEPKKKEPESFVVRLQAQGGGLEKSVVLAKEGQPVSAGEAIAGLGALTAQLTKSELRERNQALIKAEKFIESVSRAGGTGPTSRSFTNTGVRGKDARIDVEVLRGVNLTPR
jgi:RHS repeat-associated protein